MTESYKNKYKYKKIFEMLLSMVVRVLLFVSVLDSFHIGVTLSLSNDSYGRSKQMLVGNCIKCAPKLCHYHKKGRLMFPDYNSTCSVLSLKLCVHILDDCLCIRNKIGYICKQIYIYLLPSLN